MRNTGRQAIVHSGAYLGGHWAMAPPLGRPWPLSMQNPEGLSTKTVGEDLCFRPTPSSVPKTGLNLSEDLFFGGI